MGAADHQPRIRRSRPGPSVAPTPDATIAHMLTAHSEAELCAAIDSLCTPACLVDGEGWLIHANAACIAFAGRTPAPREDRWSIAWRLYAESGAFLPADQSPMAIAIRQKAPVRGAVVVAEREDGSRVTFLPYPTPIVNAEGIVVGAIDLFIEVTDGSQPDALAVQAARCRRLAESVNDPRTVETLTQMAQDYEEAAINIRLQSES
jgi:PAS domain-containing protein